MSDVAVIVTGDDAALAVTLKKDGEVFAINTSATVKAALVTTDRETVLIPATVCDSAVDEADWANSLVLVQFTDTQTAAVEEFGHALLEVQVDDGGKLTWFIDAAVIKGSIS